MAKKFMKVVSIVLPLITVVILASQLLGHPALKSNELLEELRQGDEVVLEYVEPQRPDYITVAGDIEDSYTPVDSEEDSEIGLIGSEAPEAKQEDKTKLYIAYQATYDCCVGYTSVSLEDQLNKEVRDLPTIASGFVSLPDNYEEDYKAWRIENCGTGFTQAETSESNDTESTPVADYGFSEVDETLYATSQVNLRSGPGTNFDKQGSLSTGATVHRIGIGTGTAEGWSLIELSDGTRLCVSSKYLSYSKPSVSTGNTGGGTSGTSGGSGGQSQVQQPSSAPSDSSSDDWGFNPWEGMTEEEIQQILEDSHDTEFKIHGT